MKTHTHSSQFSGFDDFIEVFRAGTHTDSAGIKKTWTENDLDQMIANHNASDAAPIVLGHAGEFAYGWSADLKREGNVLLAKFKQVTPQFEQWVKSGNVKNRSIRILNSDKGLRLGHVAFLGKTPPAITGLAPIEFNAHAGEHFDFSSDFEMDGAATGLIAQAFRNMREFLIAQFEQEKADSVLPNADIDALNQIAFLQTQEEQEEVSENCPNCGGSGCDSCGGGSNPMGGDAPSSFSHNGGGAMSVTKEELDKEKQAREAAEKQVSDFAAENAQLKAQQKVEKKARLRTEYQAVIDTHLKRGVAPALLIGAVDFMMQLNDDAQTGVFEFSMGADGATKKTSQLEFMKGLFAQLPAAVKTGVADFSEAESASLDTAEGITKAATAYQFSQKQQGFDVSIIDAVAHVTKKGQ
jgi:hypothetical protein